MSERILEADLPRSIVEHFSMDSNDRVTIRTEQDVAPTLDFIKRMGNLNVTRDSKAKKGTFRHVASIPNIIWDKLQNEMAEKNLSKDERQAYLKKFLNGDGSWTKFDKSFQV